MEHKLFKILSIVLFLISILFVTLYDYFVLIEDEVRLKIGLKVTPVLLNMLYITLYIFFYRLTIYSSVLLLSLFLCLLGDISLGVYDPSIKIIHNIDKHDNLGYFLIGGCFFLLARLLLTLIFALRPYDRMILIHFQKKKLIISHVLFSAPFILLAIINLIFIKDLRSVGILIYIICSFGFPMSYAFLRMLYPLQEILESFYSCLSAFIGISLFNLSDLLLFVYLLYPSSGNTLNTINNPKVLDIISINIYWLALYLITISVIRSSFYTIEKGIYLEDL